MWDGVIISNVGLTKEIAEGMVRFGAADMPLVVFTSVKPGPSRTICQ
jgi:hypothetical protein